MFVVMSDSHTDRDVIKKIKKDMKAQHQLCFIAVILNCQVMMIYGKGSM